MRPRLAASSRRSAALERLSAGLVIWVAISRARLAYCGARIERRSAISDSGVVVRKRRPNQLQVFDGIRPDRLIEAVPEDQRRDSGAQARGRGAGAAVVNDRAAGGKDGRVVHRAHNFDVLEMWNTGEVVGARADQRSLA